MVQKPSIQYIQFYTQGSTAQKVTPEAFPSKVFDTPKVRKRKAKSKRKVVCLDPFAILGFVVAGAMLISMMAGVYQLHKTRQQAMEMEQYVQRLTAENDRLAKEFESGYDLAEIEKAALAMGMIPQEQATHLEVPMQMPQEEKAPTVWEQITTFLSGLFA